MWKIERRMLVFVALLGCGFYYQLRNIQPTPFQPVGTGVYTKVILMIMWAALIWVYWEHHKKNKNHKDEIDNGPLIPPGIMKWQIVTFFTMMSFCLFFKILGYFTTGYIVLVVYMHALFYAQTGHIGKADSVKMVGYGTLTMLMLYIVFDRMFELWLPTGLFF